MRGRDERAWPVRGCAVFAATTDERGATTAWVDGALVDDVELAGRRCVASMHRAWSGR